MVGSDRCVQAGGGSSKFKNMLLVEVEQAWCGIYGMAPTIQAQHVVAVTIPTIALIYLTYLWYKKRSNSVTRGRNDPGGGGGTSRKRTRHRNTTTTTVSTMPIVTVPTCNVDQELFPEAMKNAMQKAMRDLQTASPIQEVCSDSEERTLNNPENNTRDLQPSVTDSSDDVVAINKTYNLETSAAIASLEENNESKIAETDDLTVELDNEKKEDKSEEEEKEANAEDVLNHEEGENVSMQDTATIEVGDNTTQWSAKSPVNEKNNSTDKKTRQEIGYCCTPVASPSCERKNNIKSCQENANTCNAEDNLDVAMQKLESMRIGGEKPKRKSNSSKKPPHAASKSGDTAAINAVVTVADNSDASTKSKLPASSASQLSTSSSKTRRGKSRKKSKNHSCGNGDENGTCDGSKKLVKPDVTTKSTCDSEKHFDPCERSSKNTKSTYRVCSSESENVYRNFHEDDSIRCNLKKSGDYDLKVIEHHHEDCDYERDSANHSPVDTMLDSQSVQFSDAHSEGSSDSGKGCSEGAASPTPQTPADGNSISEDQNIVLLYQFDIPQEHVGKLIGKHGTFINNIKSVSNTRIYIKKHPTLPEKKICALEGTQQEIHKALELIRVRFPEETYPDVTLEEFPISIPIACPLRPELFQLDLVEGVNNDVVISSLVNAGHLFLQQPMHPTYQSLTLLNLSMNQVYNSPEAPVVLKPVKDNIVAAPAMDGWYRAQIVSVDKETETCEVRFVDYGGYLTLSTSCLRAVRADFLTLPFQAVECFLADVSPINDTWCEEAKLVVQGLTYGQILKAQICDYTPEGIPLILLFSVHGSQAILINQDLVARGFAYPTLSNDCSEKYFDYS